MLLLLSIQRLLSTVVRKYGVCMGDVPDFFPEIPLERRLHLMEAGGFEYFITMLEVFQELGIYFPFSLPVLELVVS